MEHSKGIQMMQKGFKWKLKKLAFSHFSEHYSDDNHGQSFLMYSSRKNIKDI